ncbi:class I SAM-dependent methyltransferase [Actinomycetospora straminea]|uniref:Methyltransferase domain-containing protein n=1 Tax=Actinomycetospora straminea TaxID=663607 RepID=A0ABP9DX82_9PSEU|nr:class I SAM-dependent methyltransferase [Actinomycetospora straminea]MDD7936253.1 class I SAM-dependent methyltransferase [Actinomycetospora straminea]
MTEPERATAESSRPARAFLPAMGRESLLPVYDLTSRLLGAGPAHARLVAQAAPPAGGRVLEIGCGTGNVLAAVARRHPDVELVGIDPDTAALDRARGKLPAGVRLEHAYADDLPLPDADVDRVLSSLMLHHLPPEQQRGALREVRRVLRPGGSLHLVDMEGEPSRSPLARLTTAAMRWTARGAGGGQEAHGHGHGHGHGHQDDGDEPRRHLTRADDVLALMREAGLVDAAVVQRRRWTLGTLGFYTARVPA